MRIIHLTPGTGSFHCGSCLRDNALIKALRGRGHDALMVPLYLPLVTDREEASPEQPVRVGGISLYLQQKFPWFHRMPKFVHRWINSPGLLRKASERMGMTSAKDLGEMTLGSLAGEDGRQWAEWKKLVLWLKEQPKADVISLSNSLLTGLAGAIKKETGAWIVCSLQGEDSFLDTLISPYREQCGEALRANAKNVDLFIAPSRFYADSMALRLGVETSKVAVMANGIDASPFPISDPDPNSPMIGYLARMIHGKGLTVLVDAFIELVRRNRVPRVRLKVGGAFTPADEKYVADLKSRLEAAGCRDRVEFLPNLDFTEKMRFFRDLTVFSVPAIYGEAFGLYVIEALACGVPVVQPDSGAFPELIAATQGGLICRVDDAVSLADELERVIADPMLREKLSLQGMQSVRQHFHSGAMAERFEEMVSSLVN
jgi:glycosyltransferase involved in cell wall biosynthesis